MSARGRAVLVAWLVVAVRAVGTEPGDPSLPPGARVRLGTDPSDSGHAPFAAAFSPDGKLLALGGQDRAVHVWDASAGREVARLQGHEDWVLAVAFAPDGRTVASGGRDRTVRLWDAAGRELRALTPHTSAVLAVTFSPDGKLVASASQDRTIVLSDAATGTEQRRLRGHTDWTGPLAFAPDGRTLASGSWDGTVRLWDVARGTERHCLGEPDGRILAVAFTADGTTVAAATRSRIVRWQADTGKRRGAVSNPVPLAQCLAFSPDAGRLVAGERDGTLQLWETAGGREYCPFGDGRYPVQCLAFTPDGKTLAAGNRDAPALLWDLNQAAAAGRPGVRKLTADQLARLWTDLASDDSPQTARTLWTLRQAPDALVPFLRRHFQTLTKESRRIVDLIGQLDDDRFVVRQRAEDALDQLGSQAEPNLRAALKAKLSLDVCRRIERLLEKLDKQPTVLHPDHRRGRRALRALARIDTPEARALLEDLAEGPPTFWLTQEAKAVLEQR